MSRSESTLPSASCRWRQTPRPLPDAPDLCHDASLGLPFRAANYSEAAGMNCETRVAAALAVSGLPALLAACGGGAGSLGNAPPPSLTLAVARVFPALSFASPVGMMQAPGDANRWFIIEQTGRIRVFANQAGASTTTDFLDVSGRIACCGEMGLLGVAFHPQFPADPRVYVSYTAYEGVQLVSRLAEYRSRDGGATLDPSSELILLHVNQPETNHNGGDNLFSPGGNPLPGPGRRRGAGGGAGPPRHRQQP